MIQNAPHRLQQSATKWKIKSSYKSSAGDKNTMHNSNQHVIRTLSHFFQQTSLDSNQHTIRT